MERITQKMLERLVTIINEETSSPVESWVVNNEGRYVAQIGNYHLSGAYGGVCLHRMSSEGGGVHDVFSCGHVTKRDLYNRMHAFRSGLRAD